MNGVNTVWIVCWNLVYSRAVGIWKDRTWRYPIIAGTTTIPVIIILRDITDGLYVTMPPLVAGFLVGAWAANASVSNTRTGWCTGLASGLSLIYGGVEFHNLGGWF
ncbi:DUF5518 domain-containing protein [Halogeometricum borinquense]|uniref:DUF5518 domain-containing protein n=1 Tax=Halogeometricum borinquense TaxID=60847 RepID=UPI003CCDF3A5